MARKRIEIDYEELDKLLKMQCTLRECASFFEISEDTIERAVKRDKKMSFKEYRDIKREGGKVSLRRAQWQKAIDSKDTTILIWLGKQYLGQTDKAETKVEVKDTTADLSGFTTDELREIWGDGDGK